MLMTAEKAKIGFIGTGVMGKSMAFNLMKKGYQVSVYTRTKAKAGELLENGAKWCDSPKEICEEANVIITMVGYPSDVEEVYFGENGLIHHAKEGTYLIDMTTSKPALAATIYEEAKKRGIHALDAPVSGGDIGAREGRLSIMVGGDEEDFQTVMPVFEALGTNIVYHGKAGSGQHTKMCNQIVVATQMIGVAEAMAYAVKSGLDPEKVLKSITTGAAASWSLSNLAPKMIKGDFKPGFYIKHIIKDMDIALEEAESMGMEIPGVALASSIYKKLAEQGEENSGTQAIFKYWDN